ncbi:MAG: hypothetical protein ACLPND_17730, partial [Candidatus Korobacteraceae bacterium]
MNIPARPSFLFLISACSWSALLQSEAFAQASPVSSAITISSTVPPDVPNGSSASVADLAYFAWQEFIALNWPSLVPAATGQRGRPDLTADFLSIKKGADGNYPLLVWQTYRHKNELFPADGKTDLSFDSNAPTYKYKGPPIKP